MISWSKLSWTLLTINVPIPFDKLYVLILGGYYYRKGDKSICAKILIIFTLITAIAFLSFILPISAKFIDFDFILDLGIDIFSLLKEMPLYMVVILYAFELAICFRLLATALETHIIYTETE